MPADDLAEPDRFPGAPHPREQARLVGQGRAEQAFLDAWGSGRLPHAWLIGGATGVGKATLAYRIARFVLAGGGFPSLDVPADHPAARQVAALSHPGLAVLRRVPAADGKAAPTEIKVDEVRRALQLFTATTADGGYRVCVLDSVEDLNASGANAILKMVEEPPPRSLFLIVSHHPGRLLPTIRSRCRPLPLRRLDPGEVGAAVRGLGAPWSALPAEALLEGAEAADGSVRRALEALDEDRVALRREVGRLLDALPDLDGARVSALAEGVARRGAEDRFEAVLDQVVAWASARIRAAAGQGTYRLALHRLAPLAELCDRAAGAAREAAAFNLDRSPLVIALFGDLAAAIRLLDGAPARVG